MGIGEKDYVRGHGWISELIAAAAVGERDTVAAAVALDILGFDGYLGRTGRRSNLDLKTPIGGNQTFAAPSADGCARFSATANQVDVSS